MLQFTKKVKYFIPVPFWGLFTPQTLEQEFANITLSNISVYAVSISRKNFKKLNASNCYKTYKSHFQPLLTQKSRYKFHAIIFHRACNALLLNASILLLVQNFKKIPPPPPPLQKKNFLVFMLL